MQLAQSLLPNRTIVWRDTIDSTMHEAVRLANEGAPSGTIIGADEQTAGHGRFSRVWHSERGSGLYFSIILRLPIETSVMPVVTLALGCAVVEAIQLTAGITPDLRWPNDVLIDGAHTIGRSSASSAPFLHETTTTARGARRCEEPRRPPRWRN